jgi:hypothetical protein
MSRAVFDDDIRCDQNGFSRNDYWIEHTKNTIDRTGGIINYIGKGYNIKKGNPFTKLYVSISTDYGLNRHLI